jgi:hypothetical protein
MSKNLELFPTEAHLPVNVFTVRGVETKKNKPCTNRLMVVAGMALVKASGRDGGGAAMRTQASGGGG